MLIHSLVVLNPRSQIWAYIIVVHWVWEGNSFVNSSSAIIIKVLISLGRLSGPRTE